MPVYSDPNSYYEDGARLEYIKTGKYVYIEWPIKVSHKKSNRVEGGKTVFSEETIYQRIGKPFLSFHRIVDESKGMENQEEWYIEEDSSVAGGVSPEFARELVEEIQAALAYIDAQKESKE